MRNETVVIHSELEWWEPFSQRLDWVSSPGMSKGGWGTDIFLLSFCKAFHTVSWEPAPGNGRGANCNSVNWQWCGLQWCALSNRTWFYLACLQQECEWTQLWVFVTCLEKSKMRLEKVLLRSHSRVAECKCLNLDLKSKQKLGLRSIINLWHRGAGRRWQDRGTLKVKSFGVSGLYLVRLFSFGCMRGDTPPATSVLGGFQPCHMQSSRCGVYIILHFGEGNVLIHQSTGISD